MKRTDTVISIILLALTVGTLIEISKLPIGNFLFPQAGFFPLLIAILLGVLALILLGQAIKEKGKEKGNFLTSLGERKKVALTVAGLLGFIVLFESLGFLISTFLLMAFLLRSAGHKWRASIGTAVLSALACYLLFDTLLKATLPEGILKGLLGD
jgi:putative tricarboxylic transport membrane protein